MAWVEGDGNAATRVHGSPAVYYDAVGDLDKMDEKWGPSVSEFQIRTLRKPDDYFEPDAYRIAARLHADPAWAAWVALRLRQKFGWGLWSAYKSGAYVEFKGRDYDLIDGHPRAAEWNR